MDANSLEIEKLLEAYRAQGYVKIEGALSPERVEALNRAIDEVIAEEPPSLSYSLRNTVARHPAIADLMDDESILPLIVNILGYNIQLHLSHLTVRHANPDRGENPSRKNSVGWHQDGPVPRFPRVGGVTPLYYLKVCYILSDMTEPHRGNTKIVPNSGDAPFELVYKEGSRDEVEGELQMCGKPGDAFVFPQNLWHAAAPNLSDLTRRQLFIGYSYLWMRPLDYHKVEEHQLEGASPVRRQLLGQLGVDPFNYYVATRIESGLPLKAYYTSNHLDDTE